MSKLHAPAVPTHKAASISTFLTNVHLLDLDRRDDWPSISSQTFTRKNTLQNEKDRIQCVEWALYHLFEIWDHEETKDKLQPFFPAYVPLQSLNLRAALFRCLNELKKNEILGKEVIIRKTMFDDCKGEKLQDLLASFSAVVLRKVISEGKSGRASIAGRLAIAKKVPTKEHASLIPLAIAHRASLIALLRRKKVLGERYKAFGKVLSSKEVELGKRFEAIVQTQEILDANEVPDNAAARISKLFQKSWQGDRNLVDVVTGPNEQEAMDPLLDKPFLGTWSNVSDDIVTGPTEMTTHDVFEDLSNRVKSQEARLNQWKKFREVIKLEMKPQTSLKVHSPVQARAKNINPDLQRQRDLVFSPRKSPRKSDWGIRGEETEGSPIPTRMMSSNNHADQAHVTNEKAAVNGQASDIAPESKSRVNRINDLSRHYSSADDSDQSDFSEISREGLHHFNHPNNADSNHNLRPPSVKSHHGRPGLDDPSTPTIETHHEILNSSNNAENLNEDELLAEHIISMTLNAAPTPMKPKLSLAERTRQSILASASSSGLQRLTPDDAPSPPNPLQAIIEKRKELPTSTHSASTSLLERTRQSISLVPPKPRPSRHSMQQDRRNSKIYPTNQFETPRKQMDRIHEFTPPEELFSPGAGYDSVFKSRPKIGFSPVTSPAPGDSSN